MSKAIDEFEGQVRQSTDLVLEVLPVAEIFDRVENRPRLGHIPPFNGHFADMTVFPPRAYESR